MEIYRHEGKFVGIQLFERPALVMLVGFDLQRWPACPLVRNMISSRLEGVSGYSTKISNMDYKE